jgi:hypothetical protein
MGVLVQSLTQAFHLGRLPDEVRTRLEQDGGILYLAEGVVTTVIFHDFRSPQARSLYRRMVFIGYFALSERRIVVRAKCYNRVDIDLPCDDPRFQQVSFRVTPRWLSVSFDASALLANASGRIEVRMHIPDIARAVAVLQSKGATL